jgi:hypothetical protein
MGIGGIELRGSVQVGKKGNKNMEKEFFIHE